MKFSFFACAFLFHSDRSTGDLLTLFGRTFGKQFGVCFLILL